MPLENTATLELLEEIATRCQVNPRYARRIGSFGFLELEESWGDEATIINTARISTTNLRIASVEQCGEREKNLLYQLLSKNHGTPFETVHFRWRVIAPIFVLRQWMRHRICSYNEFSQRYREPMTAYYLPDRNATLVGGFSVFTPETLERYEALMNGLHRFYQDEYRAICERIRQAEESGKIPAIQGGKNPYRARARELLRNAMPVATYSDMYWTINFRSLMNFFNLRRKQDAQYEIRQYANAAFEMFRLKLPLLAETMERVLREQETK
ncbi:MAG: FAD-dependent thymidylate synthase [Magnetococcales bacterium]|nr:FAD-dependent thymidylate synthase [Magnetococcales bacterium]